MSEDLMLKKLLEITEENKKNGIVDVTVSADSVWNGKRITTFVLPRFPKSLQSEFNTHRFQIARNSASSRAISKERFSEDLLKDAYIPIWTRNVPGMTGLLIEHADEVDLYTKLYLKKLEENVKYVEYTYKNVAKQDANRMLDYAKRIAIITTSTNWEYFFNLRCASDVQPEFRRIALEMERLYHQSVPTETEWHIPWIRKTEQDYYLKDKLILSTARSAWISYDNHNNLCDLEIAQRTVNKLWKEKHGSPFEHCAKASLYGKLYDGWEEYRRFYINTI